MIYDTSLPFESIYGREIGSVVRDELEKLDIQLISNQEKFKR